MSATADLAPADLLDAARFAALREAAAHEVVSARTTVERAAAQERLTGLRRVRLAVAAAVCAQDAPERVGVALWRATEAVADETLDELAAQLCAASTGGQGR